MTPKCTRCNDTKKVMDELHFVYVSCICQKSKEEQEAWHRERADIDEWNRQSFLRRKKRIEASANPMFA